MFIFVRCIRSSAAVTPAKYELDIIQVTAILIIRKNGKNNETEKIGLVTPPLASIWCRQTNSKPYDNFDILSAYPGFCFFKECQLDQQV